MKPNEMKAQSPQFEPSKKRTYRIAGVLCTANLFFLAEGKTAHDAVLDFVTEQAIHSSVGVAQTLQKPLDL